MWKTELKARTSAFPAIAAVMAFSSTAAFAQQSPTVATDPAPATMPAVPPAPVTDSVQPTPDPAAAVPDTATTAAPATETTSTTVRKTVKRPMHAAAAAAVKTPVRATSVATAKHSTTAALHATPPAGSPPASVTMRTSQSAVQPIVDTTAPPAAAKTVAAQPAKKHDDTLPIAGGALAFLALGGAAVAMTRRRSDEEEEWVEGPTDQVSPETAGYDEPAATPIHDEEPAIVAPAASAFAWGDEDRRTGALPGQNSTGEGDDRLPGESWVQRAYRGPSPNNPSVSLRARLKRAAFFDKRERDVAAGKAEPVQMDAGLPEAMVEERELA